jgi:hypothetical protein
MNCCRHSELTTRSWNRCSKWWWLLASSLRKIIRMIKMTNLVRICQSYCWGSFMTQMLMKVNQRLIRSSSTVCWTWHSCSSTSHPSLRNFKILLLTLTINFNTRKFPSSSSILSRSTRNQSVSSTSLISSWVRSMLLSSQIQSTWKVYAPSLLPTSPRWSLTAPSSSPSLPEANCPLYSKYLSRSWSNYWTTTHNKPTRTSDTKPSQSTHCSIST